MTRDHNIAILYGHSYAQKLAGLPVINSRHNIWIKNWLRYKYKHHRIKTKTRAPIVFLMITQGTMVRYLPTQPTAESVPTTVLTFLPCRPLLLWVCVPLSVLACSQVSIGSTLGRSMWATFSSLCLCFSHHHSCSTEEPSSLPRTAEESGASKGESLNAFLVFLFVAIRQVKTLTVSQLQQTSQSTCCH